MPFPGENPGFDPNAIANARNSEMLGTPQPQAGGPDVELAPDDFSPGPMVHPSAAFDAGFSMESVGPGGPPAEAFGATTPTIDTFQATQPPDDDDHTAQLNLAEHHKIKCPKCDTVQSAANKTCTKCGHGLGEARKAKFANMDAGQSLDVYDSLALAEGDGGEDENGLVWKAVCKTGTLALSPGPGQIDIEKPLHLTADMFDEIVKSVEDPAFPHITVPTTHDNGLLENCGYVRKVAIKESEDGEKLLMAGIEFTEPDVKQRVLNGSIADTSVGVKFNYRRKRDGKLFPAALEHVALTNQPWVDGLPAFGATLSQPYDQEKVDEANALHLGVFAHPEDMKPKPEPKPEPRRRACRPRKRRPAQRNLDQRRSGDILPRRKPSGRMQSMPRDRQPRKPSDRTPDNTPKSAEELLASQQAQIDRERAERRRVEAELKASQEQVRANSEALHLSGVQQRVTQLQGEGLPPALVQRFEQIALADKPGRDASESLTLSISTTKDGETQTEDKQMSPTDIAEYLLSAVPRFGSGSVQDIVSQVSEFQLSQRPAEKDPVQTANEIERSVHPERYNQDGSRKPDDEIAKAGI